ncbi:MAG: tetratricopeptide repeat protein [Desulfobacterales bacterium]|nr:tetratricopeptide repeat protein [Desulfobacterales bacterium]MBF0396992.1 tetratricopeptide repeat protein [Desulfobacterales bacterium]
MLRFLYQFFICFLIFLSHIPLIKAQTDFELKDKGYAYYDLGIFAYEDGDYKQACDNFKKAISLSPDDPAFNHYLGKTYIKMKRYEESLTYLNKAFTKNPNLPELKYDIAMANYSLDNFSKSSAIFIEIAKEEPSNILAYYYSGISLFKQKNYQKALGYLMQASEKSPSIKSNGYFYAGICYQRIGEIDKAIDKFKYVKEKAESDDLRKNAEKWLDIAIKQKKTLKPYSFYAKIGYQYDDNVRIEPMNQNIYSDKSDFSTSGSVSGKYNFINNKDYKIGAGFSHNQTLYNNLREYDLGISTLNLYAKYQYKDMIVGLSYKPSNYWLYYSRFLMQQKITPEIMWKVKENIYARGAYSYINNDYMNHDKFDASVNDIGFDLYYFFTKKGDYAVFGLWYEDNKAESNDETYKQIDTKFGISLNIPWDINLSLNGKYSQKRYDYTDSFYRTKRSDNKYHGQISISRGIIYEWLSMQLEYNYTKNNSNFDDFTYKRNSLTFSITGTF